MTIINAEQYNSPIIIGQNSTIIPYVYIDESSVTYSSSYISGNGIISDGLIYLQASFDYYGNFKFDSTAAYENSDIDSAYITINGFGSYSYQNINLKVKDLMGDPNDVEFLLIQNDDYINASNFDDYINASTGDDEVYGNNGNDQIFGADGNDTLSGGSGNDFIDGGSGTDKAIFRGNFEEYVFSLGDSKGEKTIQISDSDTYKDGSDTIIRIESFSFNGVSYSLDNVLDKTSFDTWNYLASYEDLINTYGTDTLKASQHYLEAGSKEGRSMDIFDEWAYLASNNDLIDVFGSDTNSATQHYVTSGYKEGRNKSTFNAYQYLENNADLALAFGSDLNSATKHYVNYGYAEGRTDSSTDSGSGSGSGSGSSGSSDLTDFEALNYIASHGDLINAFGTNITSAKSHYTNYGKSEGRSLDSFSASDYLEKYSDLKNAYGDDQTSALKHYIQYGFSEGRTDTVTDSSSSSGGSSSLSDFEALNYIASHGDLINAFGTNIEAGKSHYINFGKAEGRPLDNFDEWGYIASNNDLLTNFEGNTREAVENYISLGYSQGKLTNSFDPQSYLNNYADLRNVFGNNQELATKHYVEYGFNEGRII